MIILTAQNEFDAGIVSRIVVLFGLGLVGGEIIKSLRQRENFSARELPFTWSQPNRWAEERRRILAELEHVSTSGSASTRWLGTIDLIWAAGSAGFASNETEIAVEISAFEEIVAISDEFCSMQPAAHHRFHFISSAGGLFEGQRFVGNNTLPAPSRAYGRGKLAQEERLHSATHPIEKVVYRPSSVYGHGKAGTRVGLITALLANVTHHSVSNIFGGSSTVRDYVFCEDVGKFVADCVLTTTRGPAIFLLASGKPTSIHEILHLIKSVTGKKPYLRFDRTPSNTQPITFAPSALPRDWQPTDLKTGIQKIATQVRSTFINPVGQKVSY